MKEFTLPLVMAGASVETALKTVIDAGQSGVVLKAASGAMHMLHYKSLVSAYRNKTAIDDIDADRILSVGDQPTVKLQLDTIKLAGLKFGYQRVIGGTVDLLSLRVDFANRFNGRSSGARCTRPDKPDTWSDQDWYHYYPPTRRLPGQPNICRICKSPIE